ncbi:MAG TPA: 6,7-dimethyl-8-ribityllumazine synthase [Stellaceae bacterium]|nr:6,7-dimethyl-8-ribityllumazine synthase [Stellaceae bacterium]
MTDKRIALIIGSFHREAGEIMVAAARETAVAHGMQILAEVWVPGSYEKPLALKKLLRRADIDGVAVLGIIERGETAHGHVMGQTVSDAIVQLQLEFMKPVGIGILGPDILPSQIPSRLKPYATAAVKAIDVMLNLPA